MAWPANLLHKHFVDAVVALEVVELMPYDGVFTRDALLVQPMLVSTIVAHMTVTNNDPM